jgi:peroxiredoxin
MKTLMSVMVEEKLTKGVLVFFLITVSLLVALSNSCAITQYSENARKVLPATVRIIAGDSMGSGVVVGKAGLVLTSNHVIAGNKMAEVFFVDGTRYQGRSLLTDAGKDLALIQLEGSGVQFPCANLGSSVESDGLQIGDNLEIIGYPAFTGSDAPAVTGGRISGFPGIESVQFIQTCAPVYPGNSGGPVINRFGEVIGIVNAKYSNLADRCATFVTAISEADSLIAQANGRGQFDQGRDKDSINKPIVTQTICPNVGCRAPDFTLASTAGKTYSLQSLKGKKSILIFTGEHYSLIPRSLECLMKLYESWPREQLEIIMVVRQKDDGDAADWVKAKDIKFPVLPDANGEITRLYAANAFPAFYFINAYGDIKIKRATAVDLCYEEIDTLLRLY